MRLRWPTTSPTLDITIPNSQLNNTETLQPNAIIRETRSQQPITFKAVEWPVNITSKYSIKTMTNTERTNIIDFLEQSAGSEILLTDHDSVVWIGIIITQIPEIVVVSDTHSHDIEFEFVGRKQ